MTVVNNHQGTKGVDSGVLFPPSWQGLRQQIIYLAQFGNSIQVIHGKPRAGKSTFFRHSVENGLGSTTIGVQVQDGESTESFFRAVVEEIGLRPAQDASVGQLISMLRGFVQSLHKERLRTVLIIDDAQKLGDSELGALVSILQGDAEPGIGLHVVLFAQSGFVDHLDDLQVLDVAVHDAALPPFSPTEIHQLLQSHQANLGVAPGSAQDVQLIWRQAEGLPGAALSLAKEMSSQPEPAFQKVFSLRGLPWGHLAALLVLCVVLVWAFLVRSPGESHQDRSIVSPIEVPLAPIPAAQTAPMKKNLPDAESVPDQAQSVVASLEAAPNLAQSDSKSEGLAPESSREQIETATSELDGEKTPEVGANFDNKTRDVTVGSVPSEEVSAPSVARTTAAPQSSSPERRSPASLAESEKQLLAYPSHAYVLQLMATLDLEKLMSFVAQQPNAANLLVYRTRRDNKLLYILVEGFYADKDSAAAAVVNLPIRQREGGPWPKKLEQVQQEIRKSR